MYMCIYISTYLHAYTSIYPYMYTCSYLFTYKPINLGIYICTSIYISITMSLTVYLSLCLSSSLSLSPSLYLSLSLSPSLPNTQQQDINVGAVQHTRFQNSKNSASVQAFPFWRCCPYKLFFYFHPFTPRDLQNNP